MTNYDLLLHDTNSIFRKHSRSSAYRLVQVCVFWIFPQDKDASNVFSNNILCNVLHFVLVNFKTKQSNDIRTEWYPALQSYSTEPKISVVCSLLFTPNDLISNKLRSNMLLLAKCRYKNGKFMLNLLSHFDSYRASDGRLFWWFWTVTRLN